MNCLRIKTALIVVGLLLGLVCSSQGARRPITSNPPPTSGTIVKPVVSPL
jgi:hypothetical protein